MPTSLLVYLIALLPIHFTRVHASTDIVSQLYYNSNFTAPTTPSKLNSQLTELVNTVTNFTTLPNNLQRALLWSAGWVQAAPGYADSSSSSSSATADYVQVYVLCGRSMSDTFQASLTFDNETACALRSCKANVITYTESTCDPSYVATTAHCALSLDVNVPFKQSDGPMWSTVGDIDIDSFDPQLFQYSASDADTTLYMLAEKSKWSMSDDTCPNSAIFIAPCIQVEPENVQGATWCEPEVELSVRSWLQEIAATNTSKTDNRVENISSGGISTGAIAGIIAACVVVVLVFGFVIARRRHSGGAQNQGQTGLWDDDVITANRIPREKVRVNELVSRGAFGEVYTGVFNDQRVAIKMLLPSTRRDIKLVNDFLAEAKLTASMDHPRIVTCIGVAWDSLSDLCVVMEFMEGGDLRTLLSNYEKTGHPVGFNREKVAIALHVCHALTYLHSLEPSVIHRDLKSRNILLNDANEAKLTDFGISRERLDRTMTAGVGTSLWMAPEVMTGERYDEKADMFSFGVVLSELDSHTLPYAQAKQEMQQSHGRQMSDATLLQKVAMGTVSVEFSDAAPRSMVDLGCACVSVGPTLRPSAAEALFKLQVILSKELAN